MKSRVVIKETCFVVMPLSLLLVNTTSTFIIQKKNFG